MITTPPKIHIYAWPDRFLYLGPSAKTTSHRNHAATWLVARQGVLRVNLASGEVLEDEIIFVPSEVEFATEPVTALIAALYWEPESASFKRVAEHFDASRARAFKCPPGNLQDLEGLYSTTMTLAIADKLLASVFGLRIIDDHAISIADKRIVAALQFLREAPQAYESIDALADRVHLSSSRFAHLFKQMVGVPVRRYVLWQKMRRAFDLAMAGESLTSAALSAGFADSAHLSRTVRSIIGVAPEFLFRHRDRLVVHQ